VNRPLRVCLVTASYRPYPSGVSEHVHHLAEALRDLGQEVSVLTTSFPGFGRHDSSVPVKRIGRGLLIPLNRSYGILPVSLRMSSQVKLSLHNGDFDIVHCHGLVWPEIAYWAMRHSRSVTLFTILTAGFRIHTAGSRLFRRVFRKQLAKIDGRIAISHRARQAAEPYVPGEFRIIPSGVDLTRFHPGVLPRPERKPGQQRILFLGRLDARKGIEVLLRAMPQVAHSLPNARLVVAGRGPLERDARRLAQRLGIPSRVDFLGSVPLEDLPGLYAGSEVYCAPSHGGETLGIVLLEAMASGTPVVASRIPGYDETIREGVDGILVPPDDPAGLAAALVRLLADESLRRRLAGAGLSRAQDFAWPKIAQQTLDFYLELLSRRS